MKKIIIFVLLLMLLLTGCMKKSDTQETLPETKPSEPEAEKSIIHEASWCVYWDPASAAAAADHVSQYRELVLFGCIYSEDHSLFIPDQLVASISKLPEKTSTDYPVRYLSFINDVMHPDGTSTQKSTDFLQAVLPDTDLSDAIIDDMIRQTQAFGFDGVELDYENIHKCDGLWDAYLDFVSRLYQRTVLENLKLRVVLPVSTPVDRLNFVNGPQYVVMCYNLYGNHSGPGPKADEDFLKNTYQKFKRIDAHYALANGGFEWGPQGKALQSLTAKKAASLAEETGADAARDRNGVLHYSYQAEDGRHTVYYGDEDTIERWGEILLENADKDICIDLWRLE